jgi:MFS family permease
MSIQKDLQYYKFCSYGFLKNLRFFDAFFILFLVNKGLSYTEIGILYAFREIIVNLLEIPSGIAADSFGRKNALILSFLAYIISFVIFYISTGFWVFLIAFLLYGIGEAFRSGTHKGMIMRYLQIKNQGKLKVSYYGHTRSWSQKGSAISALAAGTLVFFNGDYNSIFLFSAVPYLLNILLVFSYPSELNYTSKTTKNPIKKVQSTSRSFFGILRQPGVLKIMSTAAFHTAYLKAVKDYIQPLMVQVALLVPWMLKMPANKKNALIIGAIYFIIYLLTSTASRKAGLFDQKNKEIVAFNTLIIGFAAGIVCAFSWYWHIYWLALVAFAVIFVIESLRKPILTGAIADNVPNPILTSVLSAQSQLKTILTALIALVFGFFADTFDIATAFFAVSFTLLSLSLIIKLFSSTSLTNL